MVSECFNAGKGAVLQPQTEDGLKSVEGAQHEQCLGTASCEWQPSRFLHLNFLGVAFFVEDLRLDAPDLLRLGCMLVCLSSFLLPPVVMRAPLTSTHRAHASPSSGAAGRQNECCPQALREWLGRNSRLTCALHSRGGAHTASGGAQCARSVAVDGSERPRTV